MYSDCVQIRTPPYTGHFYDPKGVNSDYSFTVQLYIPYTVDREIFIKKSNEKSFHRIRFFVVLGTNENYLTCENVCKFGGMQGSVAW